MVCTKSHVRHDSAILGQNMSKMGLRDVTRGGSKGILSCQEVSHVELVRAFCFVKRVAS